MKDHDTRTPKRPTLRPKLDPLERIKSRWPVIAECRPLAIGIGEIIAAAMAEDIGDAITRHTSTAEYLTACAAPGAHRVNLDGTDAGPVADRHRRWARRQLRQLAKIGGAA